MRGMTGDELETLCRTIHRMAATFRQSDVEWDRGAAGGLQAALTLIAEFQGHDLALTLEPRSHHKIEGTSDGRS